MIVFQKKQTRLNEETKLVILFGTGLIGSSIGKSINKQDNYSSFFLPFDWNSLDKSRQDATRIFDHLSSILLACPKPLLSSSKIAFVWSAGKAGFTASKKNMLDELLSFDLVLTIVKKMGDCFPSLKIFFHLLSSAGGLFEGQHLVHKTTSPQPMRYYGQLKYEQEKKLLRLEGRVTKNIYRPTSVYGFIGPHQRMGLIATLISNGIKNKVSTIFGDLSTLRDYVLNDDIGAYIGKRLFYECPPENINVHLLGSGKPSSIYELRHFVEQVVGRKIYLKFLSTPETENTKDITVNSSALPTDWTPIDVKTGIRYIKESILSENTCNIPINQIKTTKNKYSNSSKKTS